MFLRFNARALVLVCLSSFLLFVINGCSTERLESSSDQIRQALSAAPADIYFGAESYARSSDNKVGAVATVHPLATQAALRVLDNGGNAVDAAVAAAFTLGVVDSHNSGIGGGNFAVIRYADGTVESIDGREMAPQLAHRDMYIQNGKANTSLSKTGPLAVGIPGSLAVYDYLLKKAGNFTLGDILHPAANLAEFGFPLSQVSHDRITATAERLKKYPATAEILLDEKQQPWPVGHQLLQKDLANTYRQIADKGVDHFYRGDFARAVAEWMEEHDGIIRYDDFANYKIRIRQPVESSYRGYTIFGFPPPSSGGVHVAQILNILETFDVKSLEKADRYHLLAEAMKLAFADRAYYLGDPDFVPVPKGLIDKNYAKQLANTISFEKVADNVTYGKPPGADIDLFGKHTTHISVADKMGNWVSITTTVNTSFGSKVTVPGTGVVLNNQMDDFSIQPDVPNAFGLVGHEANSIAPGKRPLSSMSPTIVVKDGKPIMSIGAAGGPTIITQVIQGIINQIDLGLSPDQALALPRIHHQWRPEVTFIEQALEPIKESLQERGHKFYIRKHFGSSQVVTLGADDQLHASAEPRIIERNKQDQKKK